MRFLAASIWTASAFGQRGPVLGLLTTARQAHGLTQEQAARGYPVHLRAVVTFYEPDLDPRRGSLFVEDATSGIFIAVPSRPILDLRAGSVVLVEGVSAAADYAPIVKASSLRILHETAPMPKPPRVTMQHLITGAEDGQWVEIEGIVHAVERTSSNTVMTLWTSDGPLTAITANQAGTAYACLVDAKVLLRGVAGPLFNEKKEMTGARILFPDASSVTVEEPPPSDPMTQPVESIDSILRYSPGVTLRHRVHVQGRITLDWPGRMLCIQQGTEGFCMQSREPKPLRDGTWVDVAGFPAIRNYEPTLVEATLRPGSSTVPVEPLRINPSQAATGEQNALLVQIRARVVGRSLVAGDTALLLSADGVVFPAILPPLAGIASRRPLWPEGGTVLVTGVLSGQVDAGLTAAREGGARLESFQMLMRSAADIVVVEAPPWWTGRQALTILSLVVLLTAAVLVWVALLRRRVKQQTLLIRRSEERFRHLAEHDSLTGLTSRAVLHDRLGEALEAARRKQTPVALLMMDLDHFKQVNDSLGHAAGDEILCVTAKRIRAAVRETDTVARMGGDEFIVLLPGVRGIREAGKIAAQVVANVAAPVSFRGHEVPVSVSVGISSYPDGGEDVTALLQNVDTAMYEAKSLGRNCYKFFTPDMARNDADKMEFSIALNQALSRNEFEIYYQPLVSFATGEVSGLEALLRWRSERWGLVMPGAFISIAEESGLIAAIGEWALRESCRQVGELERKLDRSLLLAVNISARQMQLGSLPRVVRQALDDFHRDPATLELEITESILISNSSRTQETFDQIRALGVRLAIDDFGTGFSSLSYITQFHVDCLKIDRSFVQNCLTDKNTQTVTKVIIAMAHGLDICVVAEGVETAEQYRFLEGASCDTAQGYYLSQPIAAAELEESLLAFQTLALQF